MGVVDDPAGADDDDGPRPARSGPRLVQLANGIGDHSEFLFAQIYFICKSKSRPKYFVPALEKGLDILEALADARGPLLLSELARQLDRSQSELFRMVACLEQRGYVIRDKTSGAFGLSLKLYELAHTHSPVDQLLRAATGPMQALARATGESCHLSVLRAGQLVVLAQAEGPAKVRLSVEVGAQFAPAHTVSGRVLLAQLPEANWPKTPGLRRRLQRIRQTVCDVAENETIRGLCDVAVLVGNPQVGVTAALAIPSLVPVRRRDNAPTLLAALQRTAREITRELGLKLEGRTP